MAQWFVELLGDGFDLEEFSSNFRCGNCVAVERDGRTYLTGSCFQGFNDAALVRERARALLEIQYGTLILLQPNLRNPKLGHVDLLHEDGRKDTFVFPEGVQVRMKGSATITVSINGQPVLPSQSRAEELMNAFNGNPHLERAIRLWADSSRGWLQLYGVLEEVESAIGQTVNKAGWTSRSQRSRFTQTANSAEAGGLKARHGLTRVDPPTSPMTLQEGTEFIHQLLMRALRGELGDRS